MRQLVQVGLGAGNMRLKIPAHEIEDLSQSLVSQGVKDLVSLFTADDNVFGAQDRQMLRSVHPLEIQKQDELSRRSLSTIS